MKKIEIDLEDILGDEYGSESVQESIRRQVIDSITKSVADGIKNRINNAVSETITDGLNKYLKKQLPALFAQMMDAEYTPVGRYGDAGKPTTLRQELLKNITENMVYRKTGSSYDRNMFTKAVDEVMEEQMKAFKSEFNKQVDATFTAAAFEYARTKLQEKLGVK